jgi:hypothetical protein
LNDRSSSACIADNSGEALPSGGVSGGPAKIAAGCVAANNAITIAGASSPAIPPFNLRKGVLTIRLEAFG